MIAVRARLLSGVGLFLVAVLSVQAGAGVATVLFPVVGPAGAVWLRLTISAVLLAAVWPPSRLRRWPWRMGWTRSAWLSVVAFGVVMAAMNAFFYVAIARAPLGVVVAIELVGPLTLALVLSRRPLDALWAVLAAAGIVLLLVEGRGGDGRLDLVGAGAALIAGALWAGYIVLSHRVGRLVPGTQGLAVALVVGALAVTPIGLTAGARLLDGRVLGLAAAVAVLSTAVAYGLELEALRRIPARLFGILASVDPVAAALVGLVLGQVLTIEQWGGIAVICLASTAATMTARPQPEHAP